MEYLDLIIKIGGVLSALGVIFGVVWKLRKAIKNFISKLDNIKSSVDEQGKHQHENYMNILRLIIMSSEMPIGERIVAGQKYLDEGGNGEVKQFLSEQFNIGEPIDKASHYKK